MKTLVAGSLTTKLVDIMEEFVDEDGSGLALYHRSDLIDCLGQ